ncbi:unnamed protein product, partial [Allacma fusca]
MQTSFDLLFLLIVSVAASAAKESLGRQSVNANHTILLKKVYRKTYSFMRHSRAFRNNTYQDAVNFVNEVEAFQAPEEFVKRFPYYLAGYDFEDRPVWVAESGNYRVGDLIDRSIELYPIFEKMFFQGAINVVKSLVARERPGKKIRQILVILDCDGLDMAVVMSDFYKFFAYTEWPRLVELGLSLGDLYLDIGVSAVAQVVLLNANYVAKLFIELSRPVVGQLIERLIVLGTNKYKWKAELRRILPEKTIPSWYGGSKDYKPLAVY